MLLSLLLSLTPTHPTTLRGFYGQQVQAWLLDQVRQCDPALSAALHAGGGPKPYTVSSLIVPDPGRRGAQGELALAPGDECLLRLTSLSADLSDLLLSVVAPELQRSTLRLKWSEFKAQRLSRENGWDGQASFDDLVQRAQGRSNPSVTLQFASPTAFRSGSVDMTMPTPDQVWRSLWWRWNTFAPQELHIDPLWPEFAANCIVVSDFTLRSMKVSFKNGTKGAATGSTGQATYRLLPEKHCGEYVPLRPGAEAVLHTLANFALFSGVGHHTTVGLGQARLRPGAHSAEAETFWPYSAYY
ncbi:MAG: CRISPR system precrRNA processing endoribonuclease RAMP protein Cas6 [Anaerolineales bacterium]|nr:CRISPR system precrRNA processing endoribonuclease RAMP protein Cas6 [Anaerolineales bacterium]